MTILIVDLAMTSDLAWILGAVGFEPPRKFWFRLFLARYKIKASIEVAAITYRRPHQTFVQQQFLVSPVTPPPTRRMMHRFSFDDGSNIHLHLMKHVAGLIAHPNGECSRSRSLHLTPFASR